MKEKRHTKYRMTHHDSHNLFCYLESKAGAGGHIDATVKQIAEDAREVLGLPDLNYNHVHRALEQAGITAVRRGDPPKSNGAAGDNTAVLHRLEMHTSKLDLLLGRSLEVELNLRAIMAALELSWISGGEK